MKYFLRSLTFYSITSTILLCSIPVYSGDGIHFGTISFENIKTDTTLEEKKNINILTEQTPQQKTLEELHPELKRQNERARELQNIPSQPSYQNNSLYPEYKKITIPEDPQKDQKIGLIKNSEIDPKVTYFLELRPFNGNLPKDIYLTSNTYHQPIARIQPGEMVKVVDSTSEFLQKMRLDRSNQIGRRQVGRKDSGDPNDLFVYYDWKNFDTLPATQSSVDLEILVPRTMSSIPVFNRPGAWTWKDCQLESDICMDKIDHHTSALLLDTSFAVISDLRTRKDVLQLYYKIGYKLIDKSGETQSRIGWIPSYYATRKISSVPRNIMSIDGKGSHFETDEDRKSVV